MNIPPGALLGTEEHSGPVFVLVVTHSDMSDVRHVWGPFTTEAAAAAAWDQLQEIGVEGYGSVRPLRQAVPTNASTVHVTSRRTA